MTHASGGEKLKGRPSRAKSEWSADHKEETCQSSLAGTENPPQYGGTFLNQVPALS